MTSKETEAYHGGVAERLRRFYRGITFQAIILGLVSFTQPGIWVALNSEPFSSRRSVETDANGRQTSEPVVKHHLTWSTLVSDAERHHFIAPLMFWQPMW